MKTLFINNFLSKYQCGFGKRFNTNTISLKLRVFGVLLRELWKVFGCLSHELIHVKLNICELLLLALQLISNFLANRKRETKINKSFNL